MSRELLILRHAKADGDADTASDFERPLTRRGKNVAREIGARLYREGLVPDYVVSSPALRARQTAVKVCKALDVPKHLIVWDTDIYNASTAALLDVLGRCPEGSATALIVGHNPGLETLILHLSGGDLDAPLDGKLLPTGTLARLEMPANWDVLTSGCAQLVSITRPRAR